MNDDTDHLSTDDLEQFLANYYDAEIKELANGFPSESRSLYVEFHDLYQYSPDAADDYLTNPDLVNGRLEQALADYPLPFDVDLDTANVRIIDSDEHQMIERLQLSDVNSDHIGQFIAVTGQLSKVTAKKPLLTTAAWTCKGCGTNNHIAQGRHDVNKPSKCSACSKTDNGSDGGPYKLDVPHSTFHDQRKLKLETPPDEAAQGEGRSITAYAVGDLTDVGGENGLADRAGQQCTIFGTLRLDKSKLEGRNAAPEVDTWFDAESVIFHGGARENVDIDAHIDDIRHWASQDDPVGLFGSNLAPALEADDKFETVLEGAVAWLFGGFRVDQDGGTYRGDLHMAVIGDPGTGKSTLLSNLAEIAPVVEYRSGTGLTKVGLTAAAQKEEFGGEAKWTLKPGVLPRANGGHCIIDEVDDIVDSETKAIHDALEGDQMVRIDKAGLSADLETRTALLASGNPEHGRFKRYEPIAEQIDLDPALISRMDVLLDLPDEIDEEKDRKKAEHYVESYNEVARKQLAGDTDVEFVTETPDLEHSEREIPVEALRSWVAYARDNIFPVPTEDAREELTEFYIDVRNLNDGHDSEADDEAIPATPRTLAAGVRLATAFARCELSNEVTVDHVERAKEITKATVGLNFDPETGEFDVDKVTATGDEATNRGDKVHRVVADLEDERDEPVPVDDVVAHAEDRHGMTDSKIEHEVEKLKQQGRLYSPSTGEVRTT